MTSRLHCLQAFLVFKCFESSALGQPFPELLLVIRKRKNLKATKTLFSDFEDRLQGISSNTSFLIDEYGMKHTRTMITKFIQQVEIRFYTDHEPARMQLPCVADIKDPSRWKTVQPSMNGDVFIELLEGLDPIKVELHRVENEIKGEMYGGQQIMKMDVSLDIDFEDPLNIEDKLHHILKCHGCNGVRSIAMVSGHG